jgi:hypothetical protein
MELTRWRLWFGQESNHNSADVLECRQINPWSLPLKRKKLFSCNKELVSRFKRGSNDSLLWFDGKVDLVDWPENLIKLANGSLESLISYEAPVQTIIQLTLFSRYIGALK